jgi:L-histidine N-alpha-methyltransferase
MAINAGKLKIIDEGRRDPRSAMKQEVLAGLTSRQKKLPSKYFYDPRGSDLFEKICGLPEYYLTRKELVILESAAAEIVKDLDRGNLIELGSGANWKIRKLLDAAKGAVSRITYIPVDVCESALRKSSEELCQRYPGLTIRGIVADMNDGVESIMNDADTLITFFGSTIGNFSVPEGGRFLRKIASAMKERDRLLVGVDLIKPKEELERAYNDEQGITAAFNRNILAVVNRELRATFDPACFDHNAFYNAKLGRVEMHLAANRDMIVKVTDLDLVLGIKRGETICTEICRKFDRRIVQAMADEAGLRISRWFSDRQCWFAVVELMPQARSRTVQSSERPEA